jgi:excisionase family DNA binding protein
MRKKSVEPVSKEILNTREAAALLKVTTQTIKNYIYSGKLEAIKTPGGHHRIRRSDLKCLGFAIEEELEAQRQLTVDEVWSAYNGLLKTFVSTVEALIRALDTRDIVSSGHSVRVADLACLVGRQLKYSEKQLQELKIAGLLHDVGKIGISEAILGKPGRLTDQEFFLVKKHSEIGEKIVSQISDMGSVAAAVRHHHERFDGTGYPDQLAGDDIELNSRIIAIADAYDFLRSDLSFRKAYSVDSSLEEIQNGAGAQFDPEITDIFVSNLRSGSIQLH